MSTWMIQWSDFVGSQTTPGYVDKITNALSNTDLIGILAGIVGVTIGFTLIYRFAARIRNTITGAMTNSKRRRY
ncbi:MAG: hypothetical protein QXI16_05390 [Sulfolobaceae archaeon]